MKGWYSMSVVVKGMKMPKDHLSCPFRGAITEMCIASEKWCNGFNEDCPLVELPKHGRLIDADILKAEWKRSEDDSEEDKAWITAVRRSINNTPTVLEAVE